ncbi:hypothetical protein COCCU_05440 [Corynebacterium occultum]|uniref:Uncharacterized protein n=2 Tax=Corynebacterium occultum TaxID=2675219 RepID=A0A6B8W0J6_9CORY|nr:hypothetical protein COCCU_05440 [Corynebacterium occultum]
MATPGPLTFSDGPVLLAIGPEYAITTWEILGHAFAERIPLSEIRTGLARLNIGGGVPENAVASLFVNDTTSHPGLAGQGQAAHNPAERALIVEACASYWEMRMQDIADAAPGMNQAAVDKLGRFSFSGEPLLNELHALRRREPSTSDEEIEQLRGVVASLRNKVAFGAAGVAAANPETLPELMKVALQPEGWAQQIALLVAAEEVIAGNILAKVRSPEFRSATETRDAITELLVLMLDNRREDLRLVEGLKELQQELEEYDPSFLGKLKHQGTLKRLIQVTQLYTPFMNMRRGSGSEDIEAEAPDDSGEELIGEFDEEALAAAYGEHFEKMLTPAIENIGELKTAYPHDDDKGIEARLHRKFLDQASGQVIDMDTQAMDLMDVVALYAMSLAILREVPVDNREKRRKQARNLLHVVKTAEVAQGLVNNPLVDRGLLMAWTTLMVFLSKQVDKRGLPVAKIGVMAPLISKWIKTNFVDNLPGAPQEAALRFLHGSPLKLLAFAIQRSIR